MATLMISLNCTAGGTTEIRLNFESRRSGSTNDNAAFRIIRRGGGQPDLVLPTEPQFILTSERDIRAWNFIDIGVPTTDQYTYTLQIKKLDGGGTFYGMVLSGHHYAK